MSELLFSVTRADCEWTYERGTGPGGQKRNKTSSKVRCFHPPSGAVGISDETRSQHQNKAIAFRAMAESEPFRNWHRLEALRKAGTLLLVEEAVDREMRRPIRVEYRVDGRWTEEEPSE